MVPQDSRGCGGCRPRFIHFGATFPKHLTREPERLGIAMARIKNKEYPRQGGRNDKSVAAYLTPNSGAQSGKK